MEKGLRCIPHSTQPYRYPEQRFIFPKFLSKCTDALLPALPNTMPRFWPLVSTLLESVPIAFTQIKQRILPCSVQLLLPTIIPHCAQWAVQPPASVSYPSCLFLLYKKWIFLSQLNCPTLRGSLLPLRVACSEIPNRTGPSLEQDAGSFNINVQSTLNKEKL